MTSAVHFEKYPLIFFRYRSIEDKIARINKMKFVLQINILDNSLAPLLSHSQNFIKFKQKIKSTQLQLNHIFLSTSSVRRQSRSTIFHYHHLHCHLASRLTLNGDWNKQFSMALIDQVKSVGSMYGREL